MHKGSLRCIKFRITAYVCVVQVVAVVVLTGFQTSKVEGGFVVTTYYEVSQVITKVKFPKKALKNILIVKISFCS